MKYEGMRPSGVDKQVPVYMFTIGKEEWKLLRGIIAHYKKNVPRTPETTAILGRLRNMSNVLNDFPVK